MKGIFTRIIYYAAAPTWSKGIMLGIAKELLWVAKEVIIDLGGSYITPIGLLEQYRLAIVVVYAPNHHQVAFWNTFCPLWYEKVQGEVILVGDLNAVADTRVDQSKVTRNPSSQGPSYI